MGIRFFACTMIDSRSQSSLVSEEFILKHQLTSTPLRSVIPIWGLDGKPLSKGSISCVTSLNVKIGDHTEIKTFSVVRMPWDLFLGVDWLQTHNPEINWKSSSIHFSCCDSGRLGTVGGIAPCVLNSSIIMIYTMELGKNLDFGNNKKQRKTHAWTQ